MSIVNTISTFFWKKIRKIQNSIITLDELRQAEDYQTRFLNNDVIGKAMLSISVKRPYTMRSVFYGSEGTIIADNMFPHIQIYTTKSPMKLEFAKVPVNVASHNVSAEIEYFLKVLLDGKHLELDTIAGANTIAAALAIGESAKKNGIPVRANLF